MFILTRITPLAGTNIKMADALHRVARKSQLILMLSQRVRVGTPDTPFRSLPTKSSLKLMVFLAMISKSFDSLSLDH